MLLQLLSPHYRNFTLLAQKDLFAKSQRIFQLLSFLNSRGLEKPELVSLFPDRGQPRYF